MSSSTPGKGHAPYKTALRSLTVSSKECIDRSAPIKCTFDNPDVCDEITAFETISCYNQAETGSRVQSTSSSYMSRDDVWLDDHQMGENNQYLLINAGQNVTILKNITHDAPILRFMYAIYIAQGSDSHLTWKLIADHKSVWTIHSEPANWTAHCIELQEHISQPLILQVGEKEDGTSTMAIDDISLSAQPCPHRFSCGFEDEVCTDLYTSVQDKAHWKRIHSGTDGLPKDDATMFADGKGSFLVPDFGPEQEEGTQAVMELENVGIDPQCLSFFLYLGDTDMVDTLQVTVNKNKVIPLMPFTRGRWTLYNIDLVGYTQSIRFVATRGNGAGITAIDEVLLSKTLCKDTLDGGGMCNFDNPNLCNVNIAPNSGSQFRTHRLKMIGSADDIVSRIHYDADGNRNGFFMYAESSSVDASSPAELTFAINTTQTAYRFWYYLFHDDAVAFGQQPELYTSIDDAEPSVIDVKGQNKWVMSTCFPLPKPFIGRLGIKASFGDGQRKLAAVDNLQLLDFDTCKDYSPSCDFEMGDTCGFISDGQTWAHTGDSWVANQSGNLTVPSLESTQTKHCFEFVYNAYDIHTVDGRSRLILFNGGKEIWSQFAVLKVGKPGQKTASVTLEGGSLHLTFATEGLGIFTIWKTKLTDGECSTPLVCDPLTEFQCTDGCIDRPQLCNRKVDCLQGEDEAESECGFRMKTNFNNVNTIEETGFTAASSSAEDWALESGVWMTVNGRRVYMGEKTLVTHFDELTINPSVMESREYYISADTACLYLSYSGNVTRFTLRQRYRGSADDVVYTMPLSPSLSRRHLAVPVHEGVVKFVLSVYMVDLNPQYRGVVPTSAVFGLYNIEINEGVECIDMPISCPKDFPNLCRNKMNCYTDDQRCDLRYNCMDGSDEMDNCGYGIPCDFEHPNLCGYRNLTLPKTYWDDRDVYQIAQTLWERTYTSPISRPNTDHTFGTPGQGHFMTSKNWEGLQDENRYVDTEIMQSPYQTFDIDGCVTFWYYLNSTAHQPKTGTAQLFVYLQYGDDGSKDLLWYDHVNRPFTDWVQGGIPVQGGKNISLVLKAVTFIPYDSWTGVVSIDDIGYQSGECNVQRPECGDSVYRCDETVCIPHEFVCDGHPDCHDGNDEQTCDRPNGGVQLVGGDGSYGQLGYFYDKQWRPVCYPSDPLEQRLFALRAAHYICRSFGYSGNFDAIPYRLWSKHSDTSIVLTCNGDGQCDATPTMEECGFFAYIKCSNEVCFVGETLCPGTPSTCKPRHYFCDGETDCPGNTDELNCKCFEDELSCNHIQSECQDNKCDSCAERGMFECKNHQCIPKSQRCDGINQCIDGSDEYRCVQIDADGVVSVYDRSSLQRKVLCVDGINVNTAQTLCSLSGKGYATEILRGNTTITNGVILSDFEHPWDVQTITGSCFPLNLLCHMTECGTTSIQDSLVQSYIINGRDTTTEEWPWYGALLGNGIIYCGVVLLSPEWALTATHCINPSLDLSVVTGSDSADESDEWAQTRFVSRKYDYGLINSGEFMIHDITVLKLSNPLQTNNFTRPICLPKQETTDYIKEMGVKAECYLVGLGATEKIFDDPRQYPTLADTLQKKRVRLVPNDVCEQEWRKGVVTDDPFPSDVVCFSHEGPSSPSCFGDSGGPVMCKNARGRWELMGVNSFGYGNCLHDVIPTVATSVLQYGRWIEEITGLS